MIEEENLVDNCARDGRPVARRLERVERQYPIIGDVRGMGLMQGMELVGEKKKPDWKTPNG